MSSTVIFAGLLVILGHAFKVMFDKTRIPDVIPMVVIGLLVGPILGWITPSEFGIMGDLLNSLALSIVLFYSGLEIDMKIINRSLPTGIKLAIFNFLLTMIITSIFSILVLKNSVIEALAIGAIIGGTSFAIVIPMANRLKIADESKTILLLESTFSDVFCIVISLGIFQMIKLREINPGFMIGQVISSFLISSIVGAIGAFFWTMSLKWIRELENDMLLTPAFIIVIFGITEFLGYSGAISSLAFGIVSGNIKKILEYPAFSMFRNTSVMEFNKEELSIFSELVFILKVFFFFYLGLSIKMSNPLMALLGLLITVLILLSRLLSSKLMIKNSNISSYDKMTISAMGPRGLVPAILLSLAVKSNFNNIELLKDFVYSAILFSIIISAVIAFYIERGKFNLLLERIFPSK